MHSLNEVKIRTRTIQCNENASANVRRDQTRSDILQGQALKKKEKKDIWTNRKDRWTKRKKDRQTKRKKDRWTNKKTADKKEDRHTKRNKDRQIKDRQLRKIIEGQSLYATIKNKMGDIFLSGQNQCHSTGVKNLILAIPFI